MAESIKIIFAEENTIGNHQGKENQNTKRLRKHTLFKNVLLILYRKNSIT
jgi:hypothetical protein